MYLTNNICYKPGSIFFTALFFQLWWVLIIYMIDLIISSKFNGRYFCLHAIVNLCLIIPFAINDIVLFLNDPISLETLLCASRQPIIITNALHIYHILTFKLKEIDIVHHIPAIIGAFGTFWWSYPISGNVQLALSLMGLPGAIDYILLSMWKEDMLSIEIEKRVNYYLNVWVRAPIANITSFCIIITMYHHSNMFDIYNKFFIIIIGLHGYWNGNFFMKEVVISYSKYKQNKMRIAVK